MKAFNALLALTFAIGIIYYQLDRRLFFYGKNDLGIYNLLPLHVTPDYRPEWERGFALRDSTGVTLAADGNVYHVDNKSVNIRKVLRYGFDKTNLVAVILDSLGRRHCLEFSDSRNDRYDFDVIIDDDCKEDSSKSYEWIIIAGNDQHINRLELWRNWLRLVIIISIPLLGYLFFRFWRRKK